MRHSFKFVAFALSLLAFSACSCNKNGEDPAPTPGFIRYSTGLKMNSVELGRPVAFDILLPEDYVSNPKRRYPVVYMLHGYGDNNTSWNGQYMRGTEKIMALEAAGLQPMIYVFPNGWNSYYSNYYTGKFNYMDMFVDELIPYIDKTYRTVADKQHRATVGYSMGGFGACVLPEKHPEVFCASVPLSMSFRTDEQYMAESQSGWDNQWGRIFGGEGKSGEERLTDYYKQHCPLHMFTPENYAELSKVDWFLTCGDDEEQLLIANDDLHVMMRDNGYSHEYRVGDGGHSSSYWRSALTEALPYIQAKMEGKKDWTYTEKIPNIPEITLDDEGAFLSEKFVEAGSVEGKAVYLFYESLAQDTVRDIIAILQRNVSVSQKFAIFPCDVALKGVPEWIGYWENELGYKAGGEKAVRSAVAIGGAGEAAFGSKALFRSLYFESATMPEVIDTEGVEFYYIGQGDDGSRYREMGALYKACKLQGREFEYRVRNSLADSVSDLLAGMEYLKSEFKF